MIKERLLLKRFKQILKKISDYNKEDLRYTIQHQTPILLEMK
jgi:hypothetical protein